MCSAHKVSLRLFVHAWAFIISTVYSGLVWKILNTIQMLLEGVPKFGFLFILTLHEPKFYLMSTENLSV
jgi:hypothetical protein